MALVLQAQALTQAADQVSRASRTRYVIVRRRAVLVLVVKAACYA